MVYPWQMVQFEFFSWHCNTTLRTASALLSHPFLLLSLALEEATFKVCFKSCRFAWRIRSSSPRNRMYVNIVISNLNITLINIPYLSRPSFGNLPRNLLILLFGLPSNGWVLMLRWEPWPSSCFLNWLLYYLGKASYKARDLPNGKCLQATCMWNCAFIID